VRQNGKIKTIKTSYGAWYEKFRDRCVQHKTKELAQNESATFVLPDQSDEKDGGRKADEHSELQGLMRNSSGSKRIN
jgi:hypothetical protein